MAVRRGARWIVVGQVASQLVSLATLAILYRLVPLEAFGLFGMALPFVMVPRTLATLGLSAAAVQRPKLSADERALLFWMQLGIGALATVFAFSFARPAALWYEVADVEPLVKLLSLTVLVACVGAAQQALFERRMQLFRVTVLRLAAQGLGSSLAIVAAFRGYDASALIVQQYAELLALVVAGWLADPWWPRLPKNTRGAWKELATFSSLYSLSSLLFVVSQNIDKLLLGLWLGDTPAGQAIVGAYTQAYNLAMRCVYVVSTPIATVSLSSLSRAAHEPRQFEVLTHNAFRLVADLLLPASIGLWLVGVDAMVVLGGDEWRNAGALLVCFAPMIAMHGWINLCGSVLAAKGKAGLLSFGALVTLLMIVQGAVAGRFAGAQAWPAPLGSALGMAIGLSLVITAVLGLPFVITAMSAVRIPWKPMLLQALGPLRASALMGLAVYGIQQLLADASPTLRLASAIVSGAAVYATLSVSELRWLRDVSQLTKES